MITSYLQKGMSISLEVKIIQKFLMDRGYGTFSISGVFGPATELAVKKYQGYNNIEQTGTVGPLTRQCINRDLSSQKNYTIYRAAVGFIGKDASPKDLADDEVGCADSVSSVLGFALGENVGIPYTVSTNLMYQFLKASHDYIQIESAYPGAIIISPSGYGNGGLSNGHVGICGEADKIMSNNSLDKGDWKAGTWQQNYTTESWKARYGTLGGFPIYYFKHI